jgi:hypothetical protein
VTQRPNEGEDTSLFVIDMLDADVREGHRRAREGQAAESPFKRLAVAY